MLKELVMLYTSFFKISGFTLGGGMVMLPLMEETFVKKKKVISHEQMLDVYAITQSLPGVIAINSSLTIGYWTAGILGALSAVLGVLTPAVIIITALAEVIQRIGVIEEVGFAFTGIRSGVTAIMLMMLIKLGKKSIKSWRELIIAAFAFIAVELLGVHPILVILLSGVLGYLMFSKESKGSK